MSNNRVLQTQPTKIKRGFSSSHSGVDLGWTTTENDGVLAHSDGVVVFCQTGHKNNQGSTGNASYGNCVKLEHANGYYTLYAHLNDVAVFYGQKVSKGQIIGHMGNTGNSYGAHLHWEVRRGASTCIDPAPYINADLPNLPTEKIKETPVNYEVSVTAKDLNVRGGPGTNYGSWGALVPGEYTVIAESDGAGASRWGKLETGGWISLDYAEKLGMEDTMTKDELYELWKEFNKKYEAEVAKKPVASWAEEAVNYVKAEGIMNGDADGAFRPESNITRQEVAAIFNNIHEKNG